MDPREGAHRAVVTYARENVVPGWPIAIGSRGRSWAVSTSRSSASTSTMLGRGPGVGVALAGALGAVDEPPPQVAASRAVMRVNPRPHTWRLLTLPLAPVCTFSFYLPKSRPWNR